MFQSKNSKKINKNEYPCKPQFYYIKTGCKGVLITQTCYPDVMRKILFVFFLFDSVEFEVDILSSLMYHVIKFKYSNLAKFIK